LNKKQAGEVIRERVPRFILSVLLALIFFLISQTVPSLVEEIIVPGIGVTPFNNAGWLIWAISTLVLMVFFVRAMSDVFILLDGGIAFFVKILGIKEEESLRRVAKDLILIIFTILFAEAILSFLKWIPDIGHLLNLVISLLSLGIVFVLIFDAGRILYRMLEDKAKSLADRLAKIVEQTTG
jgi:hypothetical protein